MMAGSVGGLVDVGGILFFFGWMFLGFTLFPFLLVLMAKWVKSAGWRFVWSCILLVVCCWPFGTLGYWEWEHERNHQARLKKEAAREAAWAASEQAAAPQIAASTTRFQELCQEESETIFRTAENVEGVFLMNPLKQEGESSDQWEDDPVDSWRDMEGWTLNYSYVDVLDAEDGKRYRYARVKVKWRYPYGKISEGRGETQRVEVTPDMPMPRYGVVWKDITEREDRERWWIAGGELKLVDLENGETMARRVRHIMAPWGKHWEGDTPVFNQKHNWRDARSEGRCPKAKRVSPVDFICETLKPAPFEIPVQVKDKPAEQ